MSRSNDRREFLRGLSATLLAGSAQALLPQLGLVGNALAATPKRGGFGNYRALVCVYLDGGNDSWNMLVPRDSGHWWRSRWVAAARSPRLPSCATHAASPTC